MCDKSYTYRYFKTSLIAGFVFAWIESAARPQEETGRDSRHCSEQPEQEESTTVGTNSTDIIFNKHDSRVEGREEQNSSDTRGDE